MKIQPTSRIKRLITNTGYRIGKWVRLFFIWGYRKLRYSMYMHAAYIGAILTLAFAPFDFLPAIPFALSGFLLFLDKKSNTLMRAGALGWWFGFGYALTSLYWIGNALFARLDDFWWLLPVAYVGIPIVVAFFFIPPAIAVYYCRKPIFKPFAFTFVWVFMEYIRSNFFIPFPWNLLGYSLAATDVTVQSAYYLGIYGGSIVLGLFGTLFYLRKMWAYTAGGLIAVIIVMVGVIRLHYANVEYHDITMRLVQPNPPEHHLGDAAKSARLLTRLVELSVLQMSPDVKHIIWPEAAFPHLIADNSRYLKSIAQLVPKDGTIIFGADRMEQILITKKYYNSIFVVDSHAKVLAYYDKESLVPFGEYIPFRKVLPFIETFAYSVGEFSVGTNASKNLTADSLPPFMPLICFEVIFPNLLRGAERPEWFLAITNDSWYGNTPGPYQHLAMAKFRAAQYGVPMIRVANTGISAVISPYGQIIKKLDLNVTGYIDHKLPKRLS